MSSTQGKPNKPPKKASPKSRVQTVARPIHPVQPNPPLNARQQSAADKLKQTVKGGGGGTGVARPDGTISGGIPSVNGGHSVAATVANPPKPKPSAQTNTLQQNLDAAAQAVNGGKPITAESYASWTAQQRYDYAEAAVALRTNSALGGVPLALNTALANAESNIPQGIASALGLVTQTNVGGTKGSKTPVDRSEANKKAWITRKSLYGSSGRKDD
jgi:hypothetical protein